MRSIVSPLSGFASPFGPQRGFNPLRIFANDEPGVWFEANDANTLFTDVAGTTPVTTPGDAVALQLDKSQGLTLGPETVDFAALGDQGTGWVKEDGIIKKISDDTTPYDFGATVGAGKYYEITFTKSNHTVGSPSIIVGGSAYSSIINVNDPNGTYTFILLAASSGTVAVTGNAARIWLSAFSVKELPGNHRTQATVAARPLYALHPVGGVRNLLEYTEEWGVPTSPWTQGSFGGTTTSTTFNDIPGFTVSATAAREFYQRSITLPAATYTISIYGELVSGSPTRAILTIGSGFIVVGDFVDGRASKTFTHAGGALTLRIGIGTDTNDTGSVTLAGIQLEEGSTATNYQRVGSFLDVSEEGKARRGRLWYNGTSHFMETGTITPGTDKVQVFAGVRKLNTGTSVLVESGPDIVSNNGSFVVNSPASTGFTRFASKGTVIGFIDGDEVSPSTGIVTGIGDISGNNATLRVNGILKGTDTDDQGTGNYLAYPLYFGARGGTSVFFNGYEDTSIIRFGPNLDATTISKVESYVASKTPASELFIPAGSELVTNGTFSDGLTGWTDISSGTGFVAVASGEANFTTNGVSDRAIIEQQITVEAGKTYAIDFTISNSTLDTSVVNIGPTRLSNTLFASGISGDGSFSAVFSPSGTTAWITVYGPNNTGTSTYDNISVREFIPK